MALTIICEGDIALTVDGAATCSTGWLSQVASVPFDQSQIDPAVAAQYFASGFALCITPIAVAWGLSQLLKFTRGI